MNTTGWAEMYVRHEWSFDHPKGCTPEQIRYREMHRHNYGVCSLQAQTLSLYDADWNEIAVLAGNDFRLRNHAGKDGTGGHNWYMTARLDVWFTHPLDGWTWFGSLITGGNNSTFKVRRTLSSPHLRPDLPWAAGHPKNGKHPFRHAFKQPVIEPDDGGTLRIADGDQTKWFAKQFHGRWHYAPSIGDLFAERLTGERLAA